MVEHMGLRAPPGSISASSARTTSRRGDHVRDEPGDRVRRKSSTARFEDRKYQFTREVVCNDVGARSCSWAPLTLDGVQPTVDRRSYGAREAGYPTKDRRYSVRVKEVRDVVKLASSFHCVETVGNESNATNASAVGALD